MARSSSSTSRKNRSAGVSAMTSPSAVASTNSSPSGSPQTNLADDTEAIGPAPSQTTAEFESEVLNCIRHVPAGAVTSYGHIAKLAGRPRNGEVQAFRQYKRLSVYHSANGRQYFKTTASSLVSSRNECSSQSGFCTLASHRCARWHHFSSWIRKALVRHRQS